MHGHERLHVNRKSHEGAMSEARCLDLIPRRAVMVRDLHLCRTGREIWHRLDEISVARRTHDIIIADEALLGGDDVLEDLASEMQSHDRWFHLYVAADLPSIQRLGVDALLRVGVEMVSIIVNPGMDCHATLADAISHLRRHGIMVVVTQVVDANLLDEAEIRAQLGLLASLDSSRARLEFVGDGNPRWSALAVDEDTRRNSSPAFRALHTAFAGYETLSTMATKRHVQRRRERLERSIRRFSGMMMDLSPSSEQERNRMMSLQREIDVILPPRPWQWMRRAARASSALF